MPRPGSARLCCPLEGVRTLLLPSQSCVRVCLMSTCHISVCAGIHVCMCVCDLCGHTCMSLATCMCTCMLVCVHVSLCMHACVYLYECVLVPVVCTYMHVCLCTHQHVRMPMCVHVYLCVFLCTCLCTCVHACVSTPLPTCVHVYLCACLCTLVSWCVCMYTCVHVCISMCACVPVCMYVCAFVCVHECIAQRLSFLPVLHGGLQGPWHRYLSPSRLWIWWTGRRGWQLLCGVFPGRGRPGAVRAPGRSSVRNWFCSVVLCPEGVLGCLLARIPQVGRYWTASALLSGGNPSMACPPSLALVSSGRPSCSPIALPGGCPEAALSMLSSGHQEVDPGVALDTLGAW